jgi:hypothetical protein
MWERKTFRELANEHKLLKRKLQEQSEQFQLERASLIVLNRSLQQSLDQERLRSRQVTSDLNRRISELEADLRKAQSDPLPRTSRRSKSGSISFSELEAESIRLEEENKKILANDRRIHATFHLPIPRSSSSTIAYPTYSQPIRQRDAPPAYTPSATREQPPPERQYEPPVVVARPQSPPPQERPTVSIPVRSERQVSEAMPVDDQPPAPSISVPPTRAVAQGHPAVFDSAPQKPAVSPSPDAFIPVRDESPPPPIPDPPPEKPEQPPPKEPVPAPPSEQLEPAKQSTPTKAPVGPFEEEEEEEEKQNGKEAPPLFVSQPILDDQLVNDDFFSSVAPSPPPEKADVIDAPPPVPPAPPPPAPAAQPKANKAAERKTPPKPPTRKRKSSDLSDGFDEDIDISWPEVESPPKPKAIDKKPTPKTTAKATEPLLANNKKVNEPNSAELFEFDQDAITFDFDGLSPFP